MTDPTEKDWCSAACADALVEGLTLHTLQAAHDVARTPEEFFWAVQASVLLNEIVKGDGKWPIHITSVAGGHPNVTP